jgi:hypothetical protein
MNDDNSDVIDGSDRNYNTVLNNMEKDKDKEKDKNKKKKLTVFVDQNDPEIIPIDMSPVVNIAEYINRKGKKHDYILAYMKATFKDHPKDTVKSWDDKYKTLGGK